jgi:hypothetical protein
MTRHLLPLLALAFLCDAMIAEDEMTGSFHNLTGVRGTPAGGTLTFGTVENANAVYVVETRAGDSLADIYARFPALPLPENGAFDEFAVEGGFLSVAGGLPGFFFTTTDPGILLAPGASGLEATPTAATRSVALAWTLPDGAPEKQVLWRNGEVIAQLGGTVTSYADDLAAAKVEPNLVYRITCFDSAPGLGQVYPSPAAEVRTRNPTAMASDAFAVTTRSLPVAVVGTPYRAQLSKNGGTDPARWTLVAGSFPAGLSLAEDGLIAGTVGEVASDPSSFAVTVVVTDAHGAEAAAPLVLKACHHPPFDGVVGEHHHGGGAAGQEDHHP